MSNKVEFRSSLSDTTVDWTSTPKDTMELWKSLVKTQPDFSQNLSEESDPKLIQFQYICKVLDRRRGDNLLPNRHCCLEQGCFLSIWALWEFKSDGKLKCFNCIMNINSTDGINTSFTAKQRNGSLKKYLT